MSQWYKPKEAKMGKYKAIKNHVSGELNLVGRYGEIFMVNDTTCKAVITSSRVARKYLPPEKHPVNKDDEVVIQFPISELEEWIKRLKITSNRNGMIRMADWFSKD